MRKKYEKGNIKFVIYVKLKFLKHLLNNILEHVDSKQVCVELLPKKRRNNNKDF